MTLDKMQKIEKINVGIDIGSTTTKVVVADSEKDEILYSDYRRHHAQQLQSVKEILKDLESRFHGKKMRFCLTGSGSKLLAEKLNLSFIQEVVANAIAVQKKI